MIKAIARVKHVIIVMIVIVVTMTVNYSYLLLLLKSFSGITMSTTNAIASVLLIAALGTTHTQ